MTSFFYITVGETENFVLNYLIYCKPMEIFQNRRNRIYMMQFWNSMNGTGSRVENKLETIDFRRRKLLSAAVNCGVNERSSNSRSSIVQAIVL